MAGVNGTQGCPYAEELINTPLQKMTPQQVKDYCEMRANVLKQAMKDADKETGYNFIEGSTTVFVTVVQEKGKPETRRVIVTSSREDGDLPDSVESSMVADGDKKEEKVIAPPKLARNVPMRDENGKIVTHKETRTRKDRKTGENKQVEVDIITKEPGLSENTGEVDANGKTIYKPYNAAKYEGKGKYGEGETKHHAEQRAKTSVKNNEEIVGMCPTKGCCNHCQVALGDDHKKIPVNYQEM